MKAYKLLSKHKQLTMINTYLNRLQAQYDCIINNKEDNWETPKEFLRIGYGDCEDYALIKYYSLIKLGFDERKLFITIVKEKFHGGDHMVLSYFKRKDRAPLILDNLSFKILPLDRRVDLNAKYFINSTGIYKIDTNFKLIKVAQKCTKFEELRDKVAKNL